MQAKYRRKYGTFEFRGSRCLGKRSGTSGFNPPKVDNPAAGAGPLVGDGENRARRWCDYCNQRPANYICRRR